MFKPPENLDDGNGGGNFVQIAQKHIATDQQMVSRRIPVVAPNLNSKIGAKTPDNEGHKDANGHRHADSDAEAHVGQHLHFHLKFGTFFSCQEMLRYDE